MVFVQSAIFVTAEHDSIFSSALTSIRTDLGREVTIFFDNQDLDCPNCLYDQDTKSSTNVFDPDSSYPATVVGPISFLGGYCPVCSGIGRLDTEFSSSGVAVLRRYIRSNDNEYQMLGRQQFVDFRLKADIQEFDPFFQSSKVVIDGIDTEVVGLRKRGLKTDIIVEIDLKRSDKDRPTTKLHDL